MKLARWRGPGWWRRRSRDNQSKTKSPSARVETTATFGIYFENQSQRHSSEPFTVDAYSIEDWKAKVYARYERQFRESEGAIAHMTVGATAQIAGVDCRYQFTIGSMN